MHHTLRVSLLVVGLLCLPSPFPNAFAATISGTAIRSTVFIGVFEGEQFSGRASGVVVSNNGDVATNKHVVEDAHGYSTGDLWIIPTAANEELNFRCKWQPKKYVASDQFDLAILYAPPTIPCATPFLTPSQTLATTSTDIRVLGYPATSYGSYTLTILKGIISGTIIENYITTYQKTDAKIIAGNSGGPVLDESNRLVGLAAATTTTTKVGEEVLGLIVPAMHIYSLYEPPAPPAAAPTPFPPDVSRDAWFGAAIGEFVAAGSISPTVPFRPGDMATRAEFIQLLVQAKGGVHGLYQQQSFSDVPMSSPYFGDFEEAGKKGWLRGAGDCYGTQPCRANPDDRVNRAEAAALLNRAFGIASRAEAPIFSDNPASAWYHEAIQTAADHCVLRGDAHDGRVRPSDPMNRAEMAVMISRITKGYTYANRCEDPTTKQRAATRSSSKSSQAPKLINDPANNPHLQCAETDSIYNSQIGKCECADGMIFSSAKNKCLTYTAFCKTKDPSAEWDPARETCYCGGDTEPSADGQKCVPTHSAICKSIDSRAFSYQGQWCVCQHGYKADESRRHCIPADPNSYYEINEREVFPGN